jgi:hypothetical protein
MLPTDLPATDDEPIQFVFGYYDDWLRPDMVTTVLDAVTSFADWELEVIIAAQAHYATNFLSPN